MAESRHHDHTVLKRQRFPSLLFFPSSHPEQDGSAKVTSWPWLHEKARPSRQSMNPRALVSRPSLSCVSSEWQGERKLPPKSSLVVPIPWKDDDVGEVQKPLCCQKNFKWSPLLDASFGPRPFYETGLMRKTNLSREATEDFWKSKIQSQSRLSASAKASLTVSYSRTLAHSLPSFRSAVVC